MTTTTTQQWAGPRCKNTSMSFGHHLRLSQLLATLLIMIIPVASTPISYFPLNSQLPPVARISKPFSFVFSPLTFSSGSPMSYSLGDGSPSWLSLDSATRTLSGTPDEASIPSDQTLIGVDFGLVAYDETGSATANVTLVVSRNPEPIVRTPFRDQIERFGASSAPASILLHPSTEFLFEFDPNTFGIEDMSDDENQRKTKSEMKRPRDDGAVDATGPQFDYYAVSGNNAPLPSWISLDAAKLALSGRTPSFESLIQPPQTFDFMLVASDVAGFSSASVKFSIVVGTHELTAKKSFIELNATRGKEFEYTDLPNILKMDERPLKNDDIASISAEGLPKWLSFDEDSWKVSGKPRAEDLPVNVTIAIVDKFLDGLNVTLAIKFKTEIFVSDLPDLNVSEGDDFAFDLKKFLVNPADTLVKAGVEPNSPWMKFDQSTKLLSGTVPETDTAKDIRVAFNATQKRTKDKETKYLKIHVNTPAAASTVTEVPEPTETPKPESKSDDLRRDLYWLLTIPAVLTAVGIILVLYLVRRRQQQSKKPDVSKVSGPLPGSFVAYGAMGASSSMEIADPEPPQSPHTRPDTCLPPRLSPIRTAQTTENPSIVVDDTTPHAITINPGAVQSPSRANVADTKIRRFTGRQGLPSPIGTDESSLLSDTSLGEEISFAEDRIFLKPGARSTPYEQQKIGLAIPSVAEIRSIQPTPEFAYTGGKKYDYVSDDDIQPISSQAARKKLERQQNPDNGLLSAQLLSRDWKRGSASKLDDSRRNSHLSASTDITTRTSILTSGITEEATTARASNIIAKPTVIHIPSRPGEARQVSRRTDNSTSFFGIRSLTKATRLTSDATAARTYSPDEFGSFAGFIKEDAAAEEGESSWDQETMDSLGIGRKDRALETRHQALGTNLGLGEYWETHHTSEELMSPDIWPLPDVMAGSRQASSQDNSSMMLRNKGKNKVTVGSNSGSVSVSSLSQTSSTRTGAQGRSWREAGLRISRIREQRDSDEFQITISRTPSPPSEWLPARDKPLTRQATPATRMPFADRSNESNGLKDIISKRSTKTLHNNKSARSTWRDGDGDDDDAWEDIVPPESTVGWTGEGSDRSFSVYI